MPICREKKQAKRGHIDVKTKTGVDFEMMQDLNQKYLQCGVITVLWVQLTHYLQQNYCFRRIVAFRKCMM